MNQMSFQKKQGEYAKVVRNKTCLVAQDFSQLEGLDFREIFTPIAHLKVIRILLSFGASKVFKLYQMNVKSDLLNGVI
jgi:hypothetical protein